MAIRGHPRGALAGVLALLKGRARVQKKGTFRQSWHIPLPTFIRERNREIFELLTGCGMKIKPMTTIAP
jgi:hypothetical protein